MAFLEMYLNGEWKNLSSFGTVSSVDIQSSSSAISVTGSPITSVGIINLSFNPSAIRLDQFAVPTSNLDINNKRIINVSDPVNPQDVATKAFVQASIPTISVTGAVIGTINSQGVINTSLSQYIPISGSFINFNWPDMGSYSSPYSLYNYLPNADPAPIFNISSQTGSGATNSLRRWSMQFSQGSATSIGYEFALSFYHSLIVGDHTVTPLRIVYSIPDDQPRMYLKAILDMYNYKIVNVPNPTASDHAANKGYIDSKTWTSTSITDFFIATTTAAKSISLDQFVVPTANINLNSNKITGLAAPTLSTDAASKGYVDYTVGNGVLPITLTGDVTGSGNTNSTITTTLNKRLDQITAPTSSVSLNSQKITSLATPTLSTDAANKSYIDSRTINDLTAPISAFSMNNNRITNVANPILAGDVATKSYVDTLGNNSLFFDTQKINFGIVPNAAVSYTVTFTKPFTNTPTVVTGLQDTSRADNINLILIQSISTTGCTVYVRTGGIQVNAFGYINIVAIGS